jgi:hypothetical protein
MELLELVLAVPSFEGDVQMFAMSLFSELLGYSWNGTMVGFASFGSVAGEETRL